MTEVLQREVLPTNRPPRTGSDDARRTSHDGQSVAPRSDVGTIVLHWATALAFVISLLTGIRIAIFGFTLPRLSHWLSPIAPQGEMWTWHFVAGLALFFCSSAYL